MSGAKEVAEGCPEYAVSQKVTHKRQNPPPPSLLGGRYAADDRKNHPYAA